MAGRKSHRSTLDLTATLGWFTQNNPVRMIGLKNVTVKLKTHSKWNDGTYENHCSISFVELLLKVPNDGVGLWRAFVMNEQVKTRQNFL